MKKFDRLPPEQRKQEIRRAAMELFLSKGFAATTMENIVSRVSLSKGGVYRLYPSSAAILRDLILEGMRLRNSYYGQQVRLLMGRPLTLEALVAMIGDSLMLYEDFSRIYVEFLWEKQRNPELEALYQQICAVSLEETAALIRSCGAESLLLREPDLLARLTDLMNTAILGIRVLGLDFSACRDRLTRAAVTLLQSSSDLEKEI